jgi:flagellar L-ring protein FlgH
VIGSQTNEQRQGREDRKGTSGPLRSLRTLRLIVVGVLCGLGWSASTFAADDKAAKGKDKPAAAAAASAENYDEQFQKYLQDARNPSGHPADAFSWMGNLALDPRARNVNDLITIRVIENIAASGTADAALNKSGSASAAVPSLFGAEKKLPGSIDPGNLAAVKTSTDFKGGGSTNRSGQLSALLTARVSEVLPNGNLVVEGVREIEINGDRQIVVLSGVVRVADIATGNVIDSTSIGQLRIRYFGKGLMKDNLKPGWLIRVLNKVF